LGDPCFTFPSSPFKIIGIGGQTITDAAVYENYAIFPEERETLLRRLHEEKI